MAREYARCTVISAITFVRFQNDERFSVRALRSWKHNCKMKYKSFRITTYLSPVPINPAAG